MATSRAKFVPGYNTLPGGRNIWLFQAKFDPETEEGYRFEEQFETEQGSFTATWCGPNWVTSLTSIKRLSQEFAPGDWIFLYQAQPAWAVVGLARVATPGYSTKKRSELEERITFDTDWLRACSPVPREVLAADRVLGEFELLKVKQGTMFRVSPKEAQRLLELMGLSGEELREVVEQWEPPSDFVAGIKLRTKGALGAARLTDAEARVAVELHAVRIARTHYEGLGFEVTVLGKPYDLRCVRLGEELHVEVKGSTTAPSSVILTRNEVEHAGQHRTDLVVVSGIKLLRPNGAPVEATGGKLRVIPSWRPEQERLKPIQYEYELPDEVLVTPEGKYPNALRLKRAAIELRVVQTGPNVSSLDALSIVARALQSSAAHRRPGAAWLAMVGESGHHLGLTRWIGLSEEVHDDVIDAVAGQLRAAGCAVQVEGSNASACPELSPELRLSDEGLERLVPAPLAKDGAPYVLEGIAGRIRGYFVE